MDAYQIQILSCPICGYAVYLIWEEKNYRVFRCKRCGVHFYKDGNTAFLYDEIYFYRWYIRSFQKRKRYLKKLLSRIEKYIKLPKGNYLDIGCGIGIFLDIAKENLWSATGIDVSPAAIAYCKKKNFNVMCGNLVQLGLPSQAFDVVVLFDVIAHLNNPSDYMKEIKRIIKDKGFLIIKTPRRSLLLFYIARFLKFTKKSRVLLHIPAQIFHFNERSLKNFCVLNGFDVMDIFTIDDLPAFLLNTAAMNVLLFFLHSFLKIFCGRDSMVVICKKKLSTE